MQPGPELDRLIADKVIGWTKVESETEYGKILILGNPAMKEKDWVSIPADWSPYPHYSTDISAAWEVVEKLNNDGWEFGLELWGGKGDDITKSWTATFAHHKDGFFFGNNLHATVGRLESDPGLKRVSFASSGCDAAYVICMAALFTTNYTAYAETSDYRQSREERLKKWDAFYDMLRRPTAPTDK
jgi:hypothetical protein